MRQRSDRMVARGLLVAPLRHKPLFEVVNESPAKSGYFPFLARVGPELVTKSPTGARTEPKLGVTGHEVQVLTLEPTLTGFSHDQSQTDNSRFKPTLTDFQVRKTLYIG